MVRIRNPSLYYCEMNWRESRLTHSVVWVLTGMASKKEYHAAA